MNVFCKQGRYNKLLCRMINDEGNTLFQKCWYDSITFQNRLIEYTVILFYNMKRKFLDVVNNNDIK